MSTLTAGVQGDPLRFFFQLSSCTCQQTVLGLPQTRVVLRNHEETCKLRCINWFAQAHAKSCIATLASIRQVRCYTLLRCIGLPWPPFCCQNEEKPVVASGTFKHLSPTLNSSLIASSACQKRPTSSTKIWGSRQKLHRNPGVHSAGECYTLLRCFGLPWPPFCCQNEPKPFVVSWTFKHLSPTLNSSLIASSACQKRPTSSTKIWGSRQKLHRNPCVHSAGELLHIP